MKIAEDWAKIGHILTSDIKQIQLDAMKEGMRRAAEINVIAPLNKYRDAKLQAILTAAEQLTEKDLC